ncbi:hypothetical protein C8F04DRAFT_1397186 [Mycena alexandri]|uniref:Uncharacterized protein n=1 Tax=Mycena alexandri TaxID=1745969 RepID=A0AAD6WZX6_9AGAR|nr:hypothetical protein C8F04DRAFT_1397186 [Mycena alexandri]
MNRYTLLDRTYRSPRFDAAFDLPNPQPAAVFTRQNESASSLRRSRGGGITHEPYPPYNAHAAAMVVVISRPQGAQKRRRIDSRPRAESASNSASASTTNSSSSISRPLASSSHSSSGIPSSPVSSAHRSSSSSRPTSTSRISSRSVSSEQSSGSPKPGSSASSITASSTRATSAITSSASSVTNRSVFFSTVIVTGPVSTVTAFSTSASPGSLGSNGSNNDGFSHNAGGIVGVALGGFIALVVGGTMLFCGCRRFRRGRERHSQAHGPAGAGAEVELIAAAATTPSAQAPEPIEEPARPTSTYHYQLARPIMPPTPAASSSSRGGFLTRLRGGHASTASNTPAALEDSAAFSFPLPQTPHSPRPSSLLNPRLNLNLTTDMPPPSPPPQSPRPGSLLNPRINVDVPGSPVVSPSPVVGWRPPPALPASFPLPPPTVPPPREDTRTPTGLLRPSLAVMQFQSSRTLDDHEDYTRPIGGRVSTRMESDMSVTTSVEEEEEEQGGESYAY